MTTRVKGMVYKGEAFVRLDDVVECLREMARELPDHRIVLFVMANYLEGFHPAQNENGDSS